jgi:hypothetical protein
MTLIIIMVLTIKITKKNDEMIGTLISTNDILVMMVLV